MHRSSEYTTCLTLLYIIARHLERTAPGSREMLAGDIDLAASSPATPPEIREMLQSMVDRLRLDAEELSEPALRLLDGGLQGPHPGRQEPAEDDE